MKSIPLHGVCSTFHAHRVRPGMPIQDTIHTVIFTSPTCRYNKRHMTPSLTWHSKVSLRVLYWTLLLLRHAHQPSGHVSPLAFCPPAVSRLWLFCSHPKPLPRTEGLILNLWPSSPATKTVTNPFTSSERCAKIVLFLRSLLWAKGPMQSCGLPLMCVCTTHPSFHVLTLLLDFTSSRKEIRCWPQSLKTLHFFLYFSIPTFKIPVQSRLKI